MTVRPQGVDRNGRRPKPTTLKVLDGSAKDHPNQRMNRNEPRPTGRVVPPPTLTPAARELWDELTPPMLAAGMLTPVDVPLFAEWVEAMVLVRLARVRVVQEATGRLEIKAGQPSPSNNYARSLAVAIALGGRFGLTPSDRARLVVPEAAHATQDLLSG